MQSPVVVQYLYFLALENSQRGRYGNSWDELTETFLNIQFDDDIQASENFKIIERFIIMCYYYKLYEDYSPDTHYSVRQLLQLFSFQVCHTTFILCRWMHLDNFFLLKKSRPLEKCYPTNDAFIQHLKRTIYQGSFIWGLLSEKFIDIPQPTEWGWKLCDKELIPHWTNLPELSNISRELLSCKCKKPCKKGRCSCKMLYPVFVMAHGYE